MERQSFYFLYVNLNSLAELALQQLAAQILAQPQAPGELENLSDEEREARVLASFENLDLSALEGLGTEEEAPGVLVDFLPQESFELPAGEPPADGGAELDIGRYLERAYSYEDMLRSRIDYCHTHADLAAIQAALAQLPAHLPPLAARLSAADMTEWLTLYSDGNAVLGDLAAQMRRLDLSAPR